MSGNNITPEIARQALDPKCAGRFLISNRPKINGTTKNIKGIYPIFACREKIVTEKLSQELSSIHNSTTRTYIDTSQDEHEKIELISRGLKGASDDDIVDIKILQRCEKRKQDTWCNIPIKLALQLIEDYSITSFADEDFRARMFRVESAYYEYLDKYCNDDAKKCTLFAFARHLHNVEPTLRSYVHDLYFRYEDWRMHKNSLPTCGAAILSEDASHVLMVQSSVHTEPPPWGFPKGKIDKQEQPISCAIREVWEEIGFDITNLIKEDYYIEYRDPKGKRFLRLYIVEGVPTNTKFTISCPYEIRAIDWHLIDSLRGRGGKVKINKPCRFLISKLKKVKQGVILKNLNKNSK